MNTKSTIESLIAAAHAAPKKFRVTTIYADGRTKTHDTATLGQAENWAKGESHKLHRDLIDRETGETVRVVAVSIDDLY